MIHAIAITRSDNSTRMWMTIAFIAGMVFAALCWFVLSPSVIPGHKYMLPQNPSVTPQKLYPPNLPDYRLVHACPGQEALL